MATSDIVAAPRFPALLLAFALAWSGLSPAAPGLPTIDYVLADWDSQQMLIVGRNFAISGDLRISLDGTRHMEITSVEDTIIRTQLPFGVKPGDYLLRLEYGIRSDQIAEIPITIGMQAPDGSRNPAASQDTSRQRT